MGPGRSRPAARDGTFRPAISSSRRNEDVVAHRCQRAPDRLIAQLAAADDVLVSRPLHNFGPPSALKAYVDHVVRVGRTFTTSEHEFAGLLKGNSACIVTARERARRRESSPAGSTAHPAC
ncbi:MAG TPA: NAD(P)H-dependent oxidoreductase [Methylomirabilota bacterium]|nr:NAD(P)H-dependent oxidoreductase [Methylomirabilota bacterium]